MKKLTIFILIMVVVVSAALFGCDRMSEKRSKDFGSYTRMVRISSEYNGDIVFDTDTGVQYWRSYDSRNKGNLTMLVDAEGKPLIYEGWEEYKK